MRRTILDSKILFKNETTYTLDIAQEASDAFWEIQPAYKKRARKFKLLAGIVTLSFAILGGMALSKQGLSVISIGALAMALVGTYAFLRAEKIIKGTARKFQGLNTKATYGITENFFFVLDREDVRDAKIDGQEALEEAEDEALEEPEDMQEEATEESAPEEEASEEDAQEENQEVAVVEEEADEKGNEFESEILAIDDLLVCIATPKIYILIWEKPYYILDRSSFTGGKDEEFREFIEERVDIIEA